MIKDIVEKLDMMLEGPMYAKEKGKVYMDFVKRIDGAKDKRALTILMTEFEKAMKKGSIVNNEFMDLIDKTDLKSTKLK
jgi:hypothetical protein